MKQKNQTSVLFMTVVSLIAIAVVAFALFSVVVRNSQNPENTSDSSMTDMSDEGDAKIVACPSDAKLCPDGSYVSRKGPNCEFSACPVVSSGGTSSSGGSTSGGTLPLRVGEGIIKGTAMLGPNCLVQSSSDPCPDTPYKTGLVLVTAAKPEMTITFFASAEDGTFSFKALPGEYRIRSNASSNTLPYCSSSTFRVTADIITEVAVHCDTGIR